MFTWYSNAAVCYAYLSDVNSGDLELATLSNSQWFTRGWALQELLAPPQVHFYNIDWAMFGTREELHDHIGRITSIPREAVAPDGRAKFCVAEKMSWAAHRITSREEDMAYCLMGLFDVNMPLLYGEGSRAFQRLQEEIMKISTDMSLFIWQGQAGKGFAMLASSPRCFSSTSLPYKLLSPIRPGRGGFALNNAGLRMTAVLNPCYGTGSLNSREIWVMPLAYLESSHTLVIFLQKDAVHDDVIYFRPAQVDKCQIVTARTDCFPLPFFSSEVRHIFIEREMNDEFSLSSIGSYHVTFVLPSYFEHFAQHNTSGTQAKPLSNWEVVDGESYFTPGSIFKFPHVKDIACMVGFLRCVIVRITDALFLVISFGLDESFRHICLVIFPLGRHHSNQVASEDFACAYRELVGRSDSSSNVAVFDPSVMMLAIRGTSPADPKDDEWEIRIEVYHQRYRALEGSRIILNPMGLVQHFLSLTVHDDLPTDCANAASRLASLKPHLWDDARNSIFHPSDSWVGLSIEV